MRMEKVTQKIILPNWWWKMVILTMVESVKHQIKQIQKKNVT